MLFADFLKCAMEETGLSNYKLAKRLNTSQTTIANWLNGTSEPREKRRAEVLDAFGVTEQDVETGNLKIKYKKEKPTGENTDGLSKDLVRLLKNLDEDGLAQVRAFAQGIAAGRATKVSPDK